MNWFRKYIIGLFEYDLANSLLVHWMVFGSEFYLMKPLIIRRLFFVHCRLGIWLYEKWTSYWFFWLSHYLERDTNWSVTQARIISNPLCPLGVHHYYKLLIYQMTPEELTKFLTDKHLLKLYRERQLRCGFTPQI